MISLKNKKFQNILTNIFILIKKNLFILSIYVNVYCNLHNQ